MTRETTLPPWNRRRLAALAVVFLALLAGSAWAGSGQPLILAVHPFLPAAEIQQRFKPLADYLAKEMQRPVSVRVGRDYDEHIKAIGGDRVDIAFLGPAGYVRLREQQGAKPLLARFEVDRQPKLFGVIAVRKDSPLKGLADLAGVRFAFGDPESTMSHIVPRYLLLQAGIPRGLPTRHAFLGSHKNVAMGVLVGDYEAGAMKKEVFEEFAAKGLRALATTPGVPDHLFVARASLPAADVQRLRQALLRLGGQPGGPAILQQLHQGLTALVPATDADYDALRGMVRTVDALRP
jgi:phosphonate transport system substrate-binding protein